jgi:hypothetical protein
MKTYMQMIHWIADKADNVLRHGEWAAMCAVAETYDVPLERVSKHVKTGKHLREMALKKQRKAEHQASNEQRRLANLANLKALNED